VMINSRIDSNRIFGGSSGSSYGAVLCALGTTCTIQNSSFRGNPENALALAGPSSVLNTSFFNNGSRAALFVFPRGQVRLNNLTFLRNAGGSFNGWAHLGVQLFGSEPYDLRVSNTLFGPTSGASVGACAFTPGTVFSGGGFNLSVDSSCDALGAGTSLVNPNVTLLAPRIANNGTSELIGLPRNSPAIDVGNPATPGSVDGACATIDPNDVIRPLDGNRDGIARCDIGAMELDLLFADGFDV
jgi:hypothetical protein